MVGSPVPGDEMDIQDPKTTSNEPTAVSALGPNQQILTTKEVQELFECRAQQARQLATTSSTQNDENEGNLLSDEEQSWRVEKLGQVLFTLEQLLHSRSADLDTIAQKIGDGSRDASWRLPIGRSGILNFFLGLIGRTGLRQTTTIQTLRVIGNSCADTDENRAQVVTSDCMPRIVNLINDDSTLPFVIPVLFNICVDYEPAQKSAFAAGINPELITLISSPRVANVDASMNIICKLLALVANREPEANFVHPATPFVLLKLATSPSSLADMEDFLGQISIALTYLSNEAFQTTFLQTPNSVSLLLKALSEACANSDLKELDAEDAAEVKKVKSIFVQALADISANPLFVASCPVGGADLQTLKQWIGSSDPDLRSAACLALGNIARSDEVCVALVQQIGLHRQLVAILADPSNTDAQSLHSALSFLKNLSIPQSNKSKLGDAGLLKPELLPRLWAMDAQVQVQFTAVSLTRLLLVSCPENVSRICATSSAGSSSFVDEPTLLSTLLNLFKRSDQEPTKTEAARAAAAVLRVLHSSPDVTALLPAQSSLDTFYTNHLAISDALVYLGTREKFPVLRSDLWFVMALMSRCPPGADVVATCLQQTELLRTLVQTVTGQDLLEGRALELVETSNHSTAASTEDQMAGSANIQGILGIPGGLEPQQVDPAKKAGMARVDRENGLVLIAELLQRCPEKLRVLPLETFREILKTGGELVLNDRDASSTQ